MYTGGVSSLAEQIANQLQSQDHLRPSLEKRDLVRIIGVVVAYSTSENELIPCFSILACV